MARRPVIGQLTKASGHEKEKEHRLGKASPSEKIKSPQGRWSLPQECPSPSTFQDSSPFTTSGRGLLLRLISVPTGHPPPQDAGPSLARILTGREGGTGRIQPGVSSSSPLPHLPVKPPLLHGRPQFGARASRWFRSSRHQPLLTHHRAAAVRRATYVIALRFSSPNGPLSLPLPTPASRSAGPPASLFRDDSGAREGEKNIKIIKTG